MPLEIRLEIAILRSMRRAVLGSNSITHAEAAGFLFQVCGSATASVESISNPLFR
jgi:hypothetical protein